MRISREDAIQSDGLRVATHKGYVYVARPALGRANSLGGKVLAHMFKQRNCRRIVIEIPDRDMIYVDLSPEDRAILAAEPASVLGALIQAEIIALRLDPYAKAFK